MSQGSTVSVPLHSWQMTCFVAKAPSGNVCAQHMLVRGRQPLVLNQSAYFLMLVVIWLFRMSETKRALRADQTALL